MPLHKAATKYKNNKSTAQTMLMRSAAFFIRMRLSAANPNDNKKAGTTIHINVLVAISPLTSSFNNSVSELPEVTIVTNSPTTVINA